MSISTSRLQTLPYCEEFATYGTGNAVFPTGWARFNNEGYDSREYVASNSSAADSRVLSFNIYLNRSAIAVLPDMDIPDIRNLFLRMEMKCSSTPENLMVEVGVMRDQYDTNSFVVVDTLRSSLSNTWEERTASLAGYSGDGRFLAFRVKNLSNSWKYLYIDRLEVLDCDIPQGVRATLNRHNIVRVNADQQTHTGFWVEYGPDGFAQGSGTFLRADTLPVDVLLAEQTTYDFYFYCDTAVPTCLPKQTVTTLPPPLSVPLCYNFDTCRNNHMPYGWRNMRVPEEYGNDCYVYNDVSHSATRSLRFCSNYTTRTPIAVIRSECEYMDECAETVDDYKESVASVSRQADKMAKLVSELLTISRMDKNTMAINFESIDLSELVTFVSEEQKEIHPEGPRLTMNIKEGVTANADRFLMARLMANLLSNAYQYTPKEGSITVSLDEDETNVTFSVQDTGIGISEEDLPKIWERFYQADSARTNENGSMGLGLSMVSWIADCHKGRVTVDSTPGKGSTFTFTFPK